MMSADLEALAPYRLELRDLLSRLASSGADDPEAVSEALQHLDGRASHEFRRLVPIDVRRAAGTFFTGSRLRSRAMKRYGSEIKNGAVVFDPACGFGDLLIAVADLIPTSWSPEARFEHARHHLRGRDINAPLADVAMERLSLWAAAAGVSDGTHLTSHMVQTGDAFADDVGWDGIDLVLLNPPYAPQQVDQGTSWATGKVTSAAPFTLEIIRRARAGTKIAAILPDVLRSGTRYGKWRDAVDALAEINELDLVGPFDTWTNVDVFVAHLTRRRADAHAGPNHWIPSAQRSTPCLQDIASISVGDVVPHRHVHTGAPRPYVTVDGLPVWATTVAAAQSIKHDGRTHEPPFVALRRTSGPTRATGTTRARAAVYAGTEAVAVENHLIVVRPLDGSLATCMELLQGLQRVETTEWLDVRLRLRHLTTKALREMPLSTLNLKRDSRGEIR
jgi:hypothetical protein